MTAPIQALPIPNVSPGQFIPAPTAGDYLQQGAGDLAKVLQAVSALHQQSQLGNRELDVRQQLGMGQIGQDQAELQQKIAEERYKQQVAAATGQGWQALLPDLPQLQGVDPSAIPGMVPQFEHLGIGRGPKTSNERDFAALQGMDPAAGSKDFRQLIMPAPNQTNVNVNTKGRTAYAEARGKGLAEGDIQAAGDAQKGLKAITSAIKARGLVDRSFTGAGANAKLNASRLMNALGLPVNKDEVVNTQELVRYAQEGTLALLGTRVLGSGTAVSDQDRAYVQSLSGENITRDPAALKKIFRVNVGLQVMQVEDAVAALRQRAREYPDEATSLLAQAQTLDDKLRPMRNAYNGMLREEHQQGKQKQAKDDQDINGILGQKGAKR